MLHGLSTIKCELRDRVATVTLSRPEAANGFNILMASELAAVAHQCELNHAVKAVLLTGEGRFFSAGGDLRAIAASGANVAFEVKRMADELHRAISTFQRMRAPLVIAVNGTCAGAGFSLAVTGDIVISAASARFTAGYTSIGLSPDGSSTYFLPRLIGLRRTQELLLTNRSLTSDEALEWGLITKVTSDADLPGTAAEVAAILAGGSVTAHAAVKELLLGSFANGLETQMELEGRLISAASTSFDGREGVGAFMEKRKPTFE